MRKRSLDVLLWRKNLRMEDVKQDSHTEREREREREAQRCISLLSKVCATVTNEEQPFQKVTKSLYIVTHLGQLPFMLFT